ncbi:MAG TPA: ArsR family transcriptional regulator [Rhodospirillaceae bacterium]|nr:ArsR family transcriptional regulator [Rhodospirillaceae bacterium]HAA92222.1 ArsR family transcriptional regulator [Rhodospirillaceae bacterium]HAT34376.1 ArsR family transcriptional regulator [Rhodospirillaceae bacterium]
MQEILQTLRAAAEGTRLRLLTLCAEGELTVSELTRITGQSQPRISRHLKQLVEAGLLERLREGTHAYYRLAETAQSAEILQTIVDAVPRDDDVIARDLAHLGEVKQDRARRAAEFFRENAEEWDAIRALYIDDGEVKQVLDATWPQKPVADFLDIGTGTGRMLEMIAHRVERAVGVDLSRDMLAVARVNIENAGLKNCQVRHGDMMQLPLPDSVFDVATFHLVLHYAERPAVALREAARVLRTGGTLIVIDFTPHTERQLLEEHGHRWLGFGDDEIQSWFTEAGLERRASVTLAGDPLTVKLWPAVKTGGVQGGPAEEIGG